MMVNAPADGWPPDSPSAAAPLGSPEPKGASEAELAQWYEAHFAFVWRSLGRFGLSSTEVEDAVQDVFLVAHRRREDFERRAAPRTWLYAIARRVASDRRRSRARRMRREEAYASSKRASSAAARDHAREHPDAWIFVEEFLASVEPDLREVFVLFELEGMRANEVSALTGTNTNTLYARRRRVRKLFGSALEQHRVDDGTLRHALTIQADPAKAPPQAKQRVAGMLPFFALPTAKVAGTAGGAGAAAAASTTSVASELGLALAPVASAWTGLKAFVVAALATSAVVGGSAVVVRSSAADPAATADQTDAVAAAPAKAPAPTADKAPSPAPEQAPPAPSAAPGQAPAAVPAALPTPGATKSSPAVAAPTALEQEVAAHKLARETLAAGDPARALSLATDYAKQYPQGRFALPNKVLRIEALCALGKRAEARSARDELLAANNDLPGRASIESLCAAE